MLAMVLSPSFRNPSVHCSFSTASVHICRAAQVHSAAAKAIRRSRGCHMQLPVQPTSGHVTGLQQLIHRGSYCICTEKNVKMIKYHANTHLGARAETDMAPPLPSRPVSQRKCTLSPLLFDQMQPASAVGHADPPSGHHRNFRSIRADARFIAIHS